jgi:hypothetical protein
LRDTQGFLDHGGLNLEVDRQLTDAVTGPEPSEHIGNRNRSTFEHRTPKRSAWIDNDAFGCFGAMQRKEANSSIARILDAREMVGQHLAYRRLPLLARIDKDAETVDEEISAIRLEALARERLLHFEHPLDVPHRPSNVVEIDLVLTSEGGQNVSFDNIRKRQEASIRRSDETG